MGKPLASIPSIMEMMKEGFTPLEPYPGIDQPWKCRHSECGQEVTARLSTVRKGIGCGYCTGRQGHEDEYIAFMRAHGFEPQADYPGAGQNWLCRHESCGKLVLVRMSSVQRGGGCGWCSGHRVSSEEHAEFARSLGFDPVEPYPGKRTKPWKCRHIECDHVVTVTRSDLQAGNLTCDWCVDNERLERLTALGFTPLEPYPGRNSAPWKCLHDVCGKVVDVRYASIKRGGRSCSYCSGKSVPVEDRIFKVRELGYEPLEEFTATYKPWLLRCNSCGEEVRPTYNNIVRGARCQHCVGQCPKDCGCNVRRERGEE